MGIEVRTHESNPNVKVVSLTGSLDAITSRTASPVIDAALQESQAGMIVDLTAVDFISSAGLSVMLAARKKADATNKKMALIHPQPAVYKIFKISGLDKIFSFFQDDEDALQTHWPSLKPQP